ncbi:stage V sporulation protein AB, partial [Shouchella clausii]
MTINVVLVMIIGFAGGLAVGSGFVAFLAVLGIIPRLTQLSKT